MTATVCVLISLTGFTGPREDTVRLTNHLKRLRGKRQLSVGDYEAFQGEYLAWIDARIGDGGNPESMNRELKRAGLFSPNQDFLERQMKYSVGYLEPIQTEQVRGTDAVRVIKAATYRSANCSLDVTALIYELRSSRLLAPLNASPDAGYYLAGIDVEEIPGGQLVASGWVASNCTSNWNGKRIRIDRVSGGSTQNVLTRDLNARDRYVGDNVSAWLRDGVATFFYEGAVRDTDMLDNSSVARYRVFDGKAVQEAPIALTRAGFLAEWLSMPDSEAARWADADAVKMRKMADLATGSVEWVRVANCGGIPAVWEIATRAPDSKKLWVFSISGSHATELHMVRIAHQTTPSCAPANIRQDLQSIGAELPW